MHIPIPTPHAKSIRRVEIVITTIHSDVMPKIFSSIGAKEKRKAIKNSVNFQSFYLHSQTVPKVSSEPSSQWFTVSHNKSGWMQNSLERQRKSLHECSFSWEIFEKWMLAKNYWDSSHVLLPSLIAVITSLKLLSVPQPSVTYFNVM